MLTVLAASPEKPYSSSAKLDGRSATPHSTADPGVKQNVSISCSISKATFFLTIATFISPSIFLEQVHFSSRNCSLLASGLAAYISSQEQL